MTCPRTASSWKVDDRRGFTGGSRREDAIRECRRVRELVEGSL